MCVLVCYNYGQTSHWLLRRVEICAQWVVEGRQQRLRSRTEEWSADRVLDLLTTYFFAFYALHWRDLQSSTFSSKSGFLVCVTEFKCKTYTTLTFRLLLNTQHSEVRK